MAVQQPPAVKAAVNITKLERENTMSAQRLTMTFAGLFILVSLALGHFTGQIDITKMGWLWLTAFVGANLTQAGLTGFCLMTKIFKASGAK